MIWRKRGESIGNWQGPMQVVAQESSRLIWVTMGSKLFRIAPEHVRPVSDVEEAENEHINKGNTQRDTTQGATQFQDLTVNSKSQEIDSWITTETIAKILRHQIPRENIMRSRWILTWKPIDPDEKHQSGSKTHPRHKPKARLAVLGSQDPQVDSIPRKTHSE